MLDFITSFGRIVIAFLGGGVFHLPVDVLLNQFSEISSCFGPYQGVINLLLAAGGTILFVVMGKAVVKIVLSFL